MCGWIWITQNDDTTKSICRPWFDQRERNLNVAYLTKRERQVFWPPRRKQSEAWPAKFRIRRAKITLSDRLERIQQSNHYILWLPFIITSKFCPHCLSTKPHINTNKSPFVFLLCFRKGWYLINVFLKNKRRKRGGKKINSRLPVASFKLDPWIAELEHLYTSIS